MIKKPPHILVTTPESLYLLLTSENGRKMLAPVHTVIVDEIHAMVDDKRGSHLALSLERLENLTERKLVPDGSSRGLVRIGLSATQNPIEQVAHFLTGVGQASRSEPDCTILNIGHRRELDLAIEVPRSPLSAKSTPASKS